MDSTIPTSLNTPLLDRDSPPILSFTSKLPLKEHPCKDTIVSNVQHYFAHAWPWNGDGEYDNFIGQDLELWTVMTLPEALDDRIEAAAMVTNLLFLVDDLLDVWHDDQRKRFFNRFRGLIFGSIQPDQNNLLETVVADIYSHIRLSDQDDPLQLGQKFCEESYRVLIASINQEERDSTMQQNNLQTYLDYRWGYGLIQWTCNIALPEHIVANPMLHSLKRAAGTHGVLINDIFSYRRETMIAKNRSASGMVPDITMNVDERTAIAYLEDRIVEAEAMMIETAERLTESYSGEDRSICERYTTAVKYVYSGNAEWSKCCGRYNRFKSV
ncbi:isoprenoid synthase domain-containing protein [Crucibulum laeve]|uniref:Isoprenoid synthase domain-containing protein n=1 Tax=Crucibulum laeve TaxID=68775 RepID=A0A5C3LSA1_9AGAR|nr:isoprenoid synthase domain-containing protein [Crucibulum laeve]